MLIWYYLMVTTAKNLLQKLKKGKTIMYDIIIQAGQSNAQGCGVGIVEKEYAEDPRILYLYDKKVIEPTEKGLLVGGDETFPYVLDVAKERMINGEKVSDFSLSFAKEYLENGMLKDGRKILIVRTAVGGSGFKKGHWGERDYLFLRLVDMVDYALSLAKGSKVVGFLWHQGEHDAFEGLLPSLYNQKLTFLLNFVRERYGKDIPFVAGDFVNEWKSKNLECCIPIVEEIKKVTKDNAKAGFVETSDLPSNNQNTGNGDEIHFCRQSLYELGKRYFKEFSKAKHEL